MDIERLTKAQIILLTLLVSFVTSIATGIVTVTLVDQAPPAITQTVNRVVERTVERVVDEDGQSAGVAEIITKEVKVIVKETDLITDAVSKVGKSIVRIYTLNKDAGSFDDARGAFLGLGVVISREGFVVTDSSIVEMGATYAVSIPDGSVYTARIKNKSPDRSTAVIEINADEVDAIFPPVAFSDIASLALGESIVTISGKDRSMVSSGIISDIVYPDDEGSAGDIVAIKTDIDLDGVVSGSPLIDMLGEVVGIYTEGGSTSVVYTPNTIVKEQLEEIFSSQNIGQAE